jgi:hypothetical protein
VRYKGISKIDRSLKMSALLKFILRFNSIKPAHILNSYKNLNVISKRATNSSSTIATNSTNLANAKSNVQKINKRIGIWLAACSGMVAGAVVLGELENQYL